MTPKKTIYVREEDQDTFERAKELADEESLSQTIAKALKDLVERKQAEEEGFKEHTLTVGKWPGGQRSHPETEEVKFYGKLLHSFTKYNGQTQSRDDRGNDYEIYQGKEKLLLYFKSWTRYQGEGSHADYYIVDNLDELEERAGDDFPGLPKGFLQDVKEEIGQEGAKKLDI